MSDAATDKQKLHQVEHLKSQIKGLEEKAVRLEKTDPKTQPQGYDLDGAKQRNAANLTEAKRQLKELTK